MSTRYMKKIYGGNVLPVGNSENESEVENSIIGNVKSKTFNVFDVVRFSYLILHDFLQQHLLTRSFKL